MTQESFFEDSLGSVEKDILVGPEVITMDTLRNWPRAEQALFKGYYRKGQVTLLAGATGLGKSTLLARHLFEMAKTGLNVVLISAEDPHDSYVRALYALALHDGIDSDELLSRIHIYTANFGDGLITKVVDTLVPNVGFLNELTMRLERHNPDCIMLETLSTMMPTDESNQAFGSAATALKVLAEKNHCSIVISHHVRKTSNNFVDDSTDMVRGGSSLTGACREVLLLRKPYVTELELIGIEKDTPEAKQAFILQHIKCSSGKQQDHQVYTRFGVQYPDEPKNDLAPVFVENRSISYSDLANVKETRKEQKDEARLEDLISSFTEIIDYLSLNRLYATATQIRKYSATETAYTGQTIMNHIDLLLSKGLVQKVQVQNRTSSKLIDVYQLAYPSEGTQDNIDF